MTKLKTEFKSKVVAQLQQPPVIALHTIDGASKDAAAKRMFVSIREMQPNNWNNIPIPLSEGILLLSKGVTDLHSQNVTLTRCIKDLLNMATYQKELITLSV